jgi:hypothetical protein
MIDFDGAGALFAGIGLATLAAALLPRAIGRLPVSMPMVFLAAGMITFTLIPDPTRSPTRIRRSPCTSPRCASSSP